MSNKKVYAIDNGLVNAVTFRFSNDYGKLLKNVVFLHLLRKENDLFFFKNNFECDFLRFSRDQIQEVIQVSYSLADYRTKQREIKGLLKIMEMLNMDTGEIVTYSEQDQLKINGKTIQIIPAWLYLLETENALI